MALKNVVGLFDNSSDAQGALQDLKDAGFSGNDISFVANNNRGDYGSHDDSTSGGTEAEEGAGFGATGGAVLGGLTGLLVGLGALAIPGIGPVVAAGTLATALGSTALGAGIGAAAGGLVGALVGAGVPEDHANIYAEGVRRGGALITVQANSDDEADRAADIMDRHNVVDIDRRGEEYRSSGFSRFDETAGDSSYASNTSYGSGGDADTSIGSDDYARSSKAGTAGGGLAGAATGAAIGSAGGPVGTVIGGVAGALTGGGIGAAGDAAGAEASDHDHNHTTGSSSMNTSATSMGSATDYGTTGTTGYNTGTTDTTSYNTGVTGTTGKTGYNNTNLDQAGEIKVPIVEEELRVGKREVEGGGVRVNTRIEEVPVSEQVTVREETVDVHRRPVNRDVTDADITNFQEGTFEVRERDEEVIVDKQARVVEEVHIKKNVEDRTETVQDTVRRTDVDVQEIGGTPTTGYADTTGTTGTTGYTDTTGTTGMTGNEGFVEGTLGNANNTIERNTGLDTDRSGNVGDRDTRNNY